MFLPFARLAALLHQLGDDARPPRLMAGAHSGAGVSVEIFVEQNQVAPVRIGLEFLKSAKDRSAAFVISKKDVRHAAG